MSLEEQECMLKGYTRKSYILSSFLKLALIQRDKTNQMELKDLSFIIIRHMPK